MTELTSRLKPRAPVTICDHSKRHIVGLRLREYSLQKSLPRK